MSTDHDTPHPVEDSFLEADGPARRIASHLGLLLVDAAGQPADNGLLELLRAMRQATRPLPHLLDGVAGAYAEVEPVLRRMAGTATDYPTCAHGPTGQCGVCLAGKASVSLERLRVLTAAALTLFEQSQASAKEESAHLRAELAATEARLKGTTQACLQVGARAQDAEAEVQRLREAHGAVTAQLAAVEQGLRWESEGPPEARVLVFRDGTRLSPGASVEVGYLLASRIHSVLESALAQPAPAAPRERTPEDVAAVGPVAAWLRHMVEGDWARWGYEDGSLLDRPSLMSPSVYQHRREDYGERLPRLTLGQCKSLLAAFNGPPPASAPVEGVPGEDAAPYGDMEDLLTQLRAARVDGLVRVFLDGERKQKYVLTYGELRTLAQDAERYEAVRARMEDGRAPARVFWEALGGELPPTQKPPGLVQALKRALRFVLHGEDAHQELPPVLPASKVLKVLTADLDMAFCPTCDGTESVPGSDGATPFCPECEDELGRQGEVVRAVQREVARRLGLTLPGSLPSEG